TAFLNFSRRLEGFQGRGSLGSGHQNATLAATKGEFASVSFFGVDGRQGPYRLEDRAGADGVIVVAGSEKVFLDNELLLRGEEEDYVIDYSTGEITFTSRHLLTANSQITVDYEFSTARYRRGLMFGGGENIPVGPLGSLRAAFFRESDDSDNPLGGDLTAEEREQLAALGDSALSVSGGTRYVGPGLGDYLLLADPETGGDIFVFVDGSGDYQVFFVEVGESRGTYEVDPDLSSETRTVYVFVGEGRGTHVVRRDLPPPQARTVANLRWEKMGEAGEIFLEGAVSDEDRNTLSDFDDGDNGGDAFWLEARADTVELVEGVFLRPAVRWRQVDEDFSAPGRIRNSFYGRDWNREGNEELEAEDLKEGSLEVGWQAWNWITEAGRLAVADTFKAVRTRQTLRYQDHGLLAEGKYLRVDQDGMGLHDGGLEQIRLESRWSRGGLEPRGKVFSETRERPGRLDGERFWEWEGALGFPVPKTRLRGEFGLGRRLDDERSTLVAPWNLRRDARRTFFSLNGQVQSLGVDMRYENRDVHLPGDEREDRNVGRMDLRHQARRGAWSANLTVDVGSFGLRQRTKEIVADSTGFFDQFGNYVGAGGGFDVQFSDFGPEVLTSQLNLRNRFRWSPRSEMEGIPTWLRKLAFEGFVDLSEASDLPLGTPRYLFSPRSYLNRDHTVNGRLRSRQTIDAFPNRKRLGLRLVHEWTRGITRNQGSVGDGLLEISNESVWTATVR
ncbi:MAG: hypothetical protein HKN21_02170, partial [Candidatus Eisenbacteria bacterium]|nr:hypothetical protein [Candidatus Eisenbacteria bacterium]